MNACFDAIYFLNGILLIRRGKIKKKGCRRKSVILIVPMHLPSWIVASNGSEIGLQARNYFSFSIMILFFSFVFQMRSGRGKWDSNPGPGNGYSSSEDDEMTRLKPNR